MAKIACENLSKSYGSNVVIQNMDLVIEGGQIVGLVGPNGSGKTTLLHLMAGLQKNYQGKIEVNGHRPDSLAAKRAVAFLSDKQFLDQYNCPENYLDLQEKFWGEQFDRARAEELLRRFDIPLKRQIRKLSKGMQEKVQITLTMARQASVYLLDEPLGGVDPIAREELFHTLINFDLRDSLVLISTHLILDLEPYIDSILFMGNKQIVLHGTCDELREKYQRNMTSLFKEVYRV